MENPNDVIVETGQEPRNSGMDPTPQFGTALGSAFAYFFSMLAFLLFICPFAFWKGATLRLYKECKNKSLKNFIQSSRWPFLSFCKKVFFEFFIDGTIFISYFIGALIAIYCLFDSGAGAFLAILVGTYYSPLFLSWIRDICVLLILPFQKFLSWVSKPAQQIDVDFHNR